MRKVVLSLVAASVLSTMTVGPASAGARRMPAADLSICSRTATSQYEFTVSWEYVKNPYQIELLSGSTTDITLAQHRSTPQLDRHGSPFSFLGLHSSYNYTYIFAVVENRKGDGPSAYFLMTNVQ